MLDLDGRQKPVSWFALGEILKDHILFYFIFLSTNHMKRPKVCLVLIVFPLLQIALSLKPIHSF